MPNRYSTLYTTKTNMIQDLLIKLYDAARDSKIRIRIEIIMSERYNQGMYVVMNWVDETGNPSYNYRGYNLDAATSKLADSTERIEGFEHSAQSWELWECDTDGTRTTLIDSMELAPINEESDNILYEVQDHFGGKYSTYENSDGDRIKLRIANHSGKHANNTYGELTISIVIANINVTERFYTQGPEGIAREYFFDDSYSVDDIISEINVLLTQEGISIN